MDKEDNSLTKSTVSPQSWREGQRALEAGEIDKGRRESMTQEKRAE